MKKVLKWIGIVLAGLVGLLVVAAVVLYFAGGSRLNRSYDIQVETIAILTDEAAIARGRHLAEAVTFCQACHGDNLGGDVIDDEPLISTITAPNLTSGRGGVGATYSDADYVQAIRHGINPEGRGLLLMHSDIFHNLSQEDLGAIIAYVKSVPPVDNELPKTRAEPLGRILVALGVFDSEAMPLIPAEVIDHNAPFMEMPDRGATAEYGRYLASITLCRMCHGSDLRGGPPIEEGSPAGPNLVALGAAGGWSEGQFISTIRTGVTPYGKALVPEFMPWDVYANMTDEELRALWMYLQSLEAR
ncbi:MAG: c-type cytochrome [Anaerolineae bacterium]